MVTFTRRHYIMIGDTLRDLDDKEKAKWLERWDKIFKEDNPRYESEKFWAYVNPKAAQAAEELAEQMGYDKNA